jgi:hypothetical protein
MPEAGSVITVISPDWWFNTLPPLRRVFGEVEDHSQIAALFSTKYNFLTSKNL